jgi:glycine/D-amino acid oxidase-like deaminating enzyme
MLCTRPVKSARVKIESPSVSDAAFPLTLQRGVEGPATKGDEGPLIAPVTSDPALPKRADAVVIGGGIVGVAAAYFLARKGISVALIEKGQIAGEQSSRNWGWCRQQNRDLRELPLMKEGIALWEALGCDAGRDLGFRRTGLVYVTKDPKELATWENWVTKAAPYQIGSRMLTGAEAREMTPGNEQDWIGGVFSSRDGRAEPGLAAPGLAEAARKLGATVHQNCAVRGIDTMAGRVSGVVTEAGRIETGAVLCAAGAWASMFCRRHGIDFPQAGVRSTVFSTTAGAEVTPGGLVTPDFTLTRRLDGGYIVAALNRGRLDITPQGIRYARQFWPMFQERRKSLKIRAGRSFFDGPEAPAGKWSLDAPTVFERHRIFAPAADRSIVAPALRVVTAAYPALAGLRMARIWGGWIDSTPDGMPVISPIEALPGFFLAAGFSGHGFGIGPAGGRLAADLMAGDRPIVDPTPFRHARLVDGTDLGRPGMM